MLRPCIFLPRFMCVIVQKKIPKSLMINEEEVVQFATTVPYLSLDIEQQKMKSYSKIIFIILLFFRDITCSKYVNSQQHIHSIISSSPFFQTAANTVTMISSLCTAVEIFNIEPLLLPFCNISDMRKLSSSLAALAEIF